MTDYDNFIALSTNFPDSPRKIYKQKIKTTNLCPNVEKQSFNINLDFDTYMYLHFLDQI